MLDRDRTSMWGSETEQLIAPLSAKRKANKPTEVDVRHAQIDRALKARERILMAEYQQQAGKQ